MSSRRVRRRTRHIVVLLVALGILSILAKFVVLGGFSYTGFGMILSGLLVRFAFREEEQDE